MGSLDPCAVPHDGAYFVYKGGAWEERPGSWELAGCRYYSGMWICNSRVTYAAKFGELPGYGDETDESVRRRPASNHETTPLASHRSSHAALSFHASAPRAAAGATSAARPPEG